MDWLTMAGMGGRIYHEARVDFGFIDEKGRAVGCLLVVEEIPAHASATERDSLGWYAPPHPAYIETRVYSLRDGRKFGAIPRGARHAAGELEAAKASLVKRADVSERRQRKVHARPEGCGDGARHARDH